MTWTPPPEIAALRDYGRKFDRPVVVTFSIERDGGRFHMTSYGQSKVLCRLAADFAKQISAAIASGEIEAPGLDSGGDPACKVTWTREREDVPASTLFGPPPQEHRV